MCFGEGRFLGKRGRGRECFGLNLGLDDEDGGWFGLGFSYIPLEASCLMKRLDSELFEVFVAGILS